MVLQCNRCSFVCQLKNIMSQHIKYNHDVAKFDVDSFVVRELRQLRKCQKMMEDKENAKAAATAAASSTKKTQEPQRSSKPEQGVSLTGEIDIILLSPSAH